MSVSRGVGLFGPNFKKWAYNLSRFNQYGLHYDDCLYEDEVVTEALRRLPAHVRDERNFRLIRATQLSINKTVLPKEQWTKYEEDTKYLQPYIAEVKKEVAEKLEWNKQ